MERIKDHPGRISQRLRNHWNCPASLEVTTHRARRNGKEMVGRPQGTWARCILHLPSQSRERQEHFFGVFKYYWGH